MSQLYFTCQIVSYFSTEHLLTFSSRCCLLQWRLKQSCLVSCSMGDKLSVSVVLSGFFFLEVFPAIFFDKTSAQAIPRVATGQESQEKVKFFSGQEKVRKNLHWSGKLEKTAKSQEKVRKNTKFSFKIQWYLQFYRRLFIKIFQPCYARHIFHVIFYGNFNFIRYDIF